MRGHGAWIRVYTGCVGADPHPTGWGNYTECVGSVGDFARTGFVPGAGDGGLGGADGGIGGIGALLGHNGQVFQAVVFVAVDVVDVDEAGFIVYYTKCGVWVQFADGMSGICKNRIYSLFATDNINIQ